MSFGAYDLGLGVLVLQNACSRLHGSIALSFMPSRFL